MGVRKKFGESVGRKEKRKHEKVKIWGLPGGRREEIAWDR